MRASAPRAFLPAVVRAGADRRRRGRGDRLDSEAASDETRRPSDIAPRHLLHLRAPGADSSSSDPDLRADAAKGDRRGDRLGQVPTQRDAHLVHHALRRPRADLVPQAARLEAVFAREEDDIAAGARLERPNPSDPIRAGPTSRSSPGFPFWSCWRSSRPGSPRTSSRDGGGRRCSIPAEPSWPRRSRTCWTTRSTTFARSRTHAAP